ncbi:MAG: UDP-N-acetylmuramoyl-tripeptide--D-alanyl-D-alanine ligase, partial [Steroidobacteraceae bacterium]
RLYATGALAARAAEAFGEGAQWFAEVPALAAALTQALSDPAPEVRVLVKGSRVNRLERVVEALARDPASATGGH